MASVYGLGKTDKDPRSGGKIVTKRHKRLNTTPYDRPPASLQLPPKNRNLISDVIFPATRLIASGAAKLWSSVFYDSDDDSSLSSSDSIPASDNDIEDDNSDDINCFVEDHGATSETMPQPSPQRSDAKHVEQLLLEGKFSRQECHRFMKLIESRVSGSNFKGGEGGISTETLNGNFGSAMDGVCSKAVLEARKWLEEKRVGYSPLPHMADRSDGLNSFSFEHINNEVGSPADVAKVYMKYRPPWASLSGEHSGVRSPLTLVSPIFRGGLFSAGEESLSSVKKRSSLASGSWNIQEEIRKVRSKATEDLLHSSSPSARLDLSSFALSPEHGQDSLLTKLSIPIGENERKMLLNSSENTEQLDQPRKVATTEGNCGISDLEVIENMAENKALDEEAIPATSVSEKDSGLHNMKIAGESTTSKPDPASKDLFKEHYEDPSRIHLKGSLVDKISKCDATQNDSGISTSVATLSTEVGIKETQSISIEKNTNDEKAADFTHKYEFLSEASVKVPTVHENDSFDKLSRGPGMGGEELSVELSWPHAVKVVKESDEVAVKPEGKKSGKYRRRNRGRGK